MRGWVTQYSHPECGICLSEIDCGDWCATYDGDVCHAACVQGLGIEVG